MILFYAIAAMSENRVIGNQGKIPWHLPEDFRWFKHMTMGGLLIMGRKTFASIGKPLPGRKTLVLTRQRIEIPGVEICPHLDFLLNKPDHRGESRPYWVCGGSDVYRQMLPLCAHLYLTRVKRTVEGDTLFPEFENSFQCEGTIHDTQEFRLERWRNLEQALSPAKPIEPWPF